MASSSTQPDAAENRSTLTPVMTLEGHEPWKFSLPNDEHPAEYKNVSCISYSSDGKQMISGSNDKTIRRWDLREGKEIKEAREVCEDISAVGVSKDGRWVVTAAGSELKVSEVETGMVRTFYKDNRNWITGIDISTDSTLLAGGLIDGTMWIWNLDTGELVAGPFKVSDGYPGPLALQLSADSRKLAVMSTRKQCLQVWDVQAQKLDIQKSTPDNVAAPTPMLSFPLPVFWTKKNKSIVAPFRLTRTDGDRITTIYEFDASTLKTVGAPFNHIFSIDGLALSSDCTLLASSSFDNTIKLWAFESRQLLASFDAKSPTTLVLSPDSRQLAYTTWDDTKIYICDIPANILASIEQLQPSTSKSKRSHHAGLLNSDATRPVRRKPVIIPVTSSIPRQPRPSTTSDPHAFLPFLRKLLSSSSRMDAVRTDEPRNPLDVCFPATSPLPRPLIKPDENSRPTPAPPTSQSSASNASPTLESSLRRLSTWWPFQTDHASPAIVDVPLAPGKLRYATAGAPGDDDDLIRDEDYVSPPPSPNPGSRPGIVNSGQHGSGRFCFCF
ncbi:YVTN repeat-like/Quino protein amine dehydrogenase [Suillus weaverae]|nr:YVTN repeat-like/Quino protein amine dehydrogenase [Suillus weaverae]